MNTPAHLALSLAVLGRRARRGDWWWIAVGAILPDALLFARALGLPREPAGAGIPVLESAVVWAVILAVSLATRSRAPALVAASALLHIAFDMPFHATDARAHFWPLSDWRYHSPLSFWDHAHHGRWIGLLEAVLFAISFAVIWTRLDRLWQMTLAVVLALVYALTFIHFLGHAFADAHWAIW